MKKIFTLVFSLGLLTASFAQGGHRNDDNKSTRGIESQSWNSGGKQKYQDQRDYKSSQFNDRDNKGYQSDYRKDDDRFDKERNDRDGFNDRNDSRIGFDDNRFHDNRFNKGRNFRHIETYKKKPALRISFNIGSYQR